MYTKEQRKNIINKNQIFDKIPKGWRASVGALTAPLGYVWINNNKSFFGGERKTALLKID